MRIYFFPVHVITILVYTSMIKVSINSNIILNKSEQYRLLELFPDSCLLCKKKKKIPIYFWPIEARATLEQLCEPFL